MKQPIYLLLLLILSAALLSACGGGDGDAATATIEPAPEEVSEETASTATSPAPGETEEQMPEEPYPAPVLPTQTPLPEGYPEPPVYEEPTPFSPYPGPDEGTAVASGDGAALAGLVYDAGDGLWQVGADGEPVQLSELSGLEPSPDLSQAAYIEGGDVFVMDLASGESVNVTEGSERSHMFVQWWAAQPDLLLLGSQGADDAGPNNGALTLVGTDGSDYRVVAEGVSFAMPEGSPDGTQIIYDEGGQPVLYDLEAETAAPFDVTAYALPDGVTISRAASGVWSPDGGSLALMMGIERADGPGEAEIALGIFDLEAETGQVLHPYVTAGRGGWFHSPRWSPDGAWVTFPVETADDTRGVWVTAADGSSEARLGGSGFPQPVWRPDSTALVLTPADNQDEVLHFAAPGWTQENMALPHMRLVSWAE